MVDPVPDEFVQGGLSEQEKRDTVVRLAFGGRRDDFDRFCAEIGRVIPPGTVVVLRGSAVTGRRWKDDAPFDSDGPGTSDLDLTPADAMRFDAARDADGSLTYVCLDTLYLRDIAKPGVQNLCDVAVARMVPRGDRVVAEGTGWAIMHVEREGEVSAR